MGPRIGMALAMVLLLASGCNPIYAPPLRGYQYGAPGRMKEGDVELSGTVGGVLLPTVGGPRVGVAIRDWVSLGAGGNFALAQFVDNWAMGYLGPRFTYSSPRKEMAGFAFDVELGVGGGVGGRCESRCGPGGTDYDGLAWSERLAMGAYQGIGIGGRHEFMAYYLRARVDEVTATNVPTTYWPSVGGGLEFDIDHKGAVNVGGGYLGYYNRHEHNDGWFYQLGGTIYFDAFRPKPHRPAE